VAEQEVASGLDAAFAEIDAQESGADTSTEALENSSGTDVESSADGQTEQLEDGTEQASEDDANYLPSEQEKVFSEEAYAKYAKRYGYTQEDLAADPRLKRTLHDKINSDILLKQRQDAEALQADEAEEEVDSGPTAQVAQPQQADWETQSTQWLDRVSDPATEKKFYQELLIAQGADPKEAAKVSQETASKVTRTLAKGVLNIMRDFTRDYFFGAEPGQQSAMAKFVDEFLNSGDYEGMKDIAKTGSRTVRGNSIKASDPRFAKLPAYNSQQFKDMMNKVEDLVPGFGDFWALDKSGNKVSQHKNRVAKMRIAARVMSGQGISVEQQKQLVAAGQKQAVNASRKAANGNFGAGQSKGKIAPRQGSNDDIYGGKDEYPLNERL
jgi:hypothetical protein